MSRLIERLENALRQLREWRVTSPTINAPLDVRDELAKSPLLEWTDSIRPLWDEVLECLDGWLPTGLGPHLLSVGAVVSLGANSMPPEDEREEAALVWMRVGRLVEVADEFVGRLKEALQRMAVPQSGHARKSMSA